MENELNENIVDTNSTTENTVDNTLNENLASDDISMALDYYDRYYEEMLKKTDNIIAKQDTIINNQYDNQTSNEQFQKAFDVIILLFGLFFIYYYLRNLIKK